MQKLKRIVIIFGALLILASLMLYTFQEKLIFLATKLPMEYQYQFSTKFDEFFLNTADGARLNALHFQSDNPKGLIIYFHGNAGNLSRWGEVVLPFVDLGYDVIVMDYRKYGKSTGKLSEKALYEDAQLFYDHSLKIFDPEQIILYGRSLGTGIASHLASKNKAAMLVLETPFHSLLEIAQNRFPFLPVKQLLNYRLPSYQWLQNAKIPIRIIHGTKDSIVAYASGQKLFESIPYQNKKMYTIPGGGHNDLSKFERYWEFVRTELE